ncbi:MAG: aldolase [Anaerolineaceae bacterium]|nr:aldolase [Anaerolineaceae bacterium]
MRGRDLKQALLAGKRVYGIAVEGYGQPRWPRFFAGLGVIDFVFMDSEHSPNNRETIAWAAQCYAAYGIAPLLRIPEISPSQAAMGLDAGAHGIIVPYVETREQVKAMVGAVKYRPLKGKALETALDTGVFPSDATRDYLPGYNPDAFLVIMIESPAGIANLADMLAFGGVDAVLVGPHDLSISLGIPEQYDHPQFIAALDGIIRTCQAHQTAVGMHLIFGTLEDRLAWVQRGFNFVSVRGDTLFIAQGAQHELTTIRSAVEGGEPSGITSDIGAAGHSR